MCMPEMNRREFMARSGGAALFGGLAYQAFILPAAALETPLDLQPIKELPAMDFDIMALPNFCSHEHWGSIDAIGQAPEQQGFRADTTAGARPTRPVSVWDLLLDPYAGGWMHAAGRDPHAPAREAGHANLPAWWEADPEAALRGFRDSVRPLTLTGAFQCTRRGIAHLYGVDLAAFDLNDWQQADAAIRARYSDIFSWYQEAMGKAHFTELIRPVHPEF